MPKKLQKYNPMIRWVIVPIRRWAEGEGATSNVAWCMAQLVSWSIKALFAVPLWFVGPHHLVFAYLGAIALFGAIAAVAPWFGYAVKRLT
jgi:hypothetical protein